MLPRPTISAVIGAEAVQVSHLRGAFKGFLDGQEAFGTPIPEDAEAVIQQGRLILTERIRRSRSSSSAALIDLSTAFIAYEDQLLKIGTKEIRIRRNTLEDFVLEYMINCCSKGDIINRDDLLNWVIEASGDETKTTKAIYDKCNDINKKVRGQIGTALNLFDTSADYQVKRNY
jgi:hypothetical protein